MHHGHRREQGDAAIQQAAPRRAAAAPGLDRLRAAACAALCNRRSRVRLPHRALLRRRSRRALRAHVPLPRSRLCDRCGGAKTGSACRTQPCRHCWWRVSAPRRCASHSSRAPCRAAPSALPGYGLIFRLNFSMQRFWEVCRACCSVLRPVRFRLLLLLSLVRKSKREAGTLTACARAYGVTCRQEARLKAWEQSGAMQLCR